MIIFTLTMWDSNNNPMKPDRLFAKVRPYKLAGHVQHTIYEYTFEEGNKVIIEVRESVDNKEPDRIRKKSAGFYGCDWMIDEIIKYGRIRPKEERQTNAIIATKESVEAEVAALKEEWIKVKNERTIINNKYNELSEQLRRKLNWLAGLTSGATQV